jgi:hypothetical protein
MIKALNKPAPIPLKVKIIFIILNANMVKLLARQLIPVSKSSAIIVKNSMDLLH